MEFLIIIFLAIILIIVSGLKSTSSDNFAVLNKRIEYLQDVIQKLLLSNKEISQELEKLKNISKVEIENEPQPVIIEPIREEAIKTEQIEEKIIIEEKQAAQIEPLPVETSVKEKAPIQVENRQINKPKPIQKEKKLSFFERNPDLEKFIGENLINKIGIGILVLGIAFFVKYAISKDWINEIGRTSIGMLCGLILIGLAHRLRKSFITFSSVLVGGGLAIFYFTITIAFHEYHVFNQITAFIIMVLITSFSVLLSISYNRKELAILALIGGYVSPILLSNGEGNYVALFSYISILNTGMLILAYFRNWKILNILTYSFTIITVFAWINAQMFYLKEIPYIGPFLFITLLYLLFFAMNIIQCLKKNAKLKPSDIILLISNTMFYFSAGMFFLSFVSSGKYCGIFTVSIAVINFIVLLMINKKAYVDTTLIYLLIGIVLSLVSISAPIQLHGNYITLFWSAEAVLLIWLATKTNIHLLRNSSLILLGIAFISLLKDWPAIYFSHSIALLNLTPIINNGFITGLFFCASLVGYKRMIKQNSNPILNLKIAEIIDVIRLIFIGTLYVVIFLELNHQLYAHKCYYATKDIVIASFSAIYLIVLNYFVAKKKLYHFIELSFILGWIVILVHPFIVHFKIIEVRNHFLNGGKVSFISFMWHYLLLALEIILIILVYKNSRTTQFRIKEADFFIRWAVAFMGLFIVSSELDHLVVIYNYTNYENISAITYENHRVGYSIIWGICSFILMYIGLKLKKKDVRIMSLSLFLITIIKLFVFDIRGISEGGKIAAFICLGVILLVVSFMYQKLKQLIFENEKEENHAE